MMQSRCRACETIRAVLTLLLRVRLHHRRTQWINRGASVQVMAMKYINAPQSTGVAVGTEQFIHRMRLHTFQAYETPHFGDKAFGAGVQQRLACTRDRPHPQSHAQRYRRYRLRVRAADCVVCEMTRHLHTLHSCQTSFLL